MSDVSFSRFSFPMTAGHIVTYFVAGLFAYALLDYRALFEAIPTMRPIDSDWVAAGPMLQVIRGLIFTVVLYPFRRIFLTEPRGWLKLWGLFLGLAIFSTAGPTPGSVEGVLYTTIPLALQLRGLPEVMLQTLALSVLLVLWHQRPRRAWNIVMGILIAIVILTSLAGVFLEPPEGLR
jgi:hypothetical protein